MAGACKDEAWLTYVPQNGAKTFTEEVSGLLDDLFGCKDTGRFFCAVEMKVELEQRSSRSAKQLFCPCCPKSALKIEANDTGAFIQCPSCSWNARRTGVNNLSELLQRDGDPYPWITEERRALSRHLEQDYADQHLNDMDATFAWISLSESGIPRGASMKRLRARRQSFFDIQRRPKDHQLTKQESAALCAQNFAREQQAKETRVFSSWMPPDTRPCLPNSKCRPVPELSLLMEELNLDDVVNPDEQVCAATWFKRDCAARRRVPKPRVTLRSPVGTHGLGIEARRIVPKISVVVLDECSGEWNGTAAVRFFVTNTTKADGIELTVSNANQRDEKGVLMLREGATDVIELKPFRLENRVAPDGFRVEKTCSGLAVLDVEFEHTSGEFSGHVWALRIFARHAAMRQT